MFKNDIKAQDNRKGYVGLSGGHAFMLKNERGLFDNGIGLGINFGYLMTNYVGINVSIFRTNFNFSFPYPPISVGLTGILAGPLFTITETGKVEFDFRPAAGYANGKLLGATSNESVIVWNSTLALGIGGSVRWNCCNRVSLSVNLDYYYGNPKNSLERMNLSSFGVSLGVNYRIK